MSRLTCPRCRLTITPRVAWLGSKHCPRCIARDRVAVAMFSSTLGADELYADRGPPGEGGDGEAGRHRGRSGGGTASTGS